MSKKAESRRQANVREALNRAFPGCWHFKVHGNEFQRAGLPDIIGCVVGLFFAFEVKEPTGKASELQKYEIEQIHKAGGIAAIVVEPKEAIELVRKAIARTSKRV